MWKIDVSEVPKNRRTDPQFLSLQAGLLAGLSDERCVNAICIHEAAHLVYFIKAGSKGPSIRGPRIRYNTERDICEGYGASVQFEGKDDAIIGRLNIAEWAYLYSLGCAAGGVAARELAGAPDGGDEDDFENLCTFCKTIEVNVTDTVFNPPALWKTAKEHISEHLKDTKRTDAIRNTADAIKQYLSQESTEG